MTLRMALGCAITMLGFVLYSHIKLASTKPLATKTNVGLGRWGCCGRADGRLGELW